MVGSGRAVWCVLHQEKHALQYNSKQQLPGCPLQNRIGKFLGLYTSPARQPGGSSVWGLVPGKCSAHMLSLRGLVRGK